MAVTQLSDGNDDGNVLGQSASDKIGFYGAPPVVRAAVTAIGTTTLSQVGTSGKWAFASSTAGKTLVASLRSIQDKLAALGLVAEG